MSFYNSLDVKRPPTKYVLSLYLTRLRRSSCHTGLHLAPALQADTSAPPACTQTGPMTLQRKQIVTVSFTSLTFGLSVPHLCGLAVCTAVANAYCVRAISRLVQFTACVLRSVGACDNSLVLVRQLKRKTAICTE